MKKRMLILSLAVSQFAFGHGGDKPGPHGGFVEMPGAFHTEVVPDKEGSFKVYLLDYKFEKPVIQNSDVQAWLLNGKKKTDLKCEPNSEANYFLCSPSDQNFKAKQLIVKAKREQMQGNEAKYDLPLKLKK